MLSQKIAALFALMVLASQGVIGRPQADSLIDSLELDLGTVAGDLGAAVLPAEAVDAAIAAAGGTPP